MSLSEDLKSIISNHGVDILSNPQVINYFSDLGVSRNYPYAIPILKDILSNYGDEIVSTYKIGDRQSLVNLLSKCRNKYLYIPIYNKDSIIEIFDSLAFSLDAKLLSMSTNQQEIDYIEECDGKFWAFELKWNPKKSKVSIPNSFKDEYNIENFVVITPDNYLQYI